MSLSWSSRSCKGRKYLIEQFQLYDETFGSDGIDYSFGKKKPKEINELVFDKHPEELGNYIRSRFPENFRDTARAYQTDRAKVGARKQCEFR